jgi:energy-coupling factor transporter ATP-binding protein EcfA2
MSNPIDESIYPINKQATDFRHMDIAAAKRRNSWDCERNLLNGKHILVIGKTGSGKTWFVAHFALKWYPVFIFVNTQIEEIVTKVTQITCYNPDEIFEALEEGYRRIEYVPPLVKEAAIDDLEEIRLRLFEIGVKLGLPEGEFWCTVIIDEAQDFIKKGRQSPGEDFFRRGRHARVRVVGITLKPQDISTTVLTQTQNQVVFLCGNFQEQYFQNHKIPYETWKPWLQQDYHYVILNQKGETSFCTPIKEK